MNKGTNNSKRKKTRTPSPPPQKDFFFSQKERRRERESDREPGTEKQNSRKWNRTTPRKPPRAPLPLPPPTTKKKERKKKNPTNAFPFIHSLDILYYLTKSYTRPSHERLASPPPKLPFCFARYLSPLLLLLRILDHPLPPPPVITQKDNGDWTSHSRREEYRRKNNLIFFSSSSSSFYYDLILLFFLFLPPPPPPPPPLHARIFCSNMVVFMCAFSSSSLFSFSPTFWLFSILFTPPSPSFLFPMEPRIQKGGKEKNPSETRENETEKGGEGGGGGGVRKERKINDIIYANKTPYIYSQLRALGRRNWGEGKPGSQKTDSPSSLTLFLYFPPSFLFCPLDSCVHMAFLYDTHSLFFLLPPIPPFLFYFIYWSLIGFD
ncbi:hypothetical protein F4775DRAFT_30704 [Biscogniauxia sp. FL1348]|nr:hypothetical protein F4775DRAFT_30704 [Biscogniauxia sp. FL1348]